MNRQNQLLRRISISKRIVILILLVSVLPILLVGSFGYLQARSAIYRTAADYNQKLVDIIKQNITLRLQEFVNLSDELILNTTVRNALESYEDMNSTQKYWTVQNIYSEVRSKYTRIADICDIRIVTVNNLPIYSTGFLYLNSEQDLLNYQRISQSKEPLLWYTTQYDDMPYIVLSRKITNLSTRDVLGYIIIHINADVLDELYSRFNLDNSAYIVLLDSFGSTLPGTGTLTAEQEKTFSDILTLEKTDDIQQYEGSSEDFIYYSAMEELGLTLVTSIPNRVLTAPIQNMFGAILLFLLVCILLSIIVSRYIWKSITGPLTKLVAYIKDTSELKFDTDFSDNSRDELGFMAQSYNNIVKIMKNMVTQIEQEQEDKRKAEIRLLQAQINPHFLFNTLDSLRFTAMMSRADTVSEGLSSLSHILRNSIIDDNSYITVSDEIRCIEDYIVIQKIRYGEFIELHKQIEPGTDDCLIMKFLLQPIVENSIIHGMQKKETLDITIQTERKDDQIEIIISDNGSGFDMDEKIDKETNIIKSSKMSGIGLENVKQRLELEFRTEQSFTIHSEKGVGTTVTITYPFRKNTSMDIAIEKKEDSDV
ncbi:MAG: histidine kinase [Mediterraneibacter sp.]